METTARHALPMIAPGQAQKELAHNEALTMLDLMTHPVVQAAGVNVAPFAPLTGQCWIVGTAPVGDWSDHADALAGWTGGGWRFVAACEGMTAWRADGSGFWRYSGGGWSDGRLVGSVLTLAGRQVVGPQQAAIMEPNAGGNVDTDARAAIFAILNALRGHGLIAS